MKILISALAAIIFPISAICQENNWKTVGTWNVKAYDFDNGCSANTIYDGGTDFYIGFNTRLERPHLEIMIFDLNWESISSGKEYPIEVYFGDETGWNLSMQGIGGGENNWPGLFLQLPIESDRTELFAEEFMGELNMRWYFDGTEMANLSLKDSRQALLETGECTKSFASINNSSDPFTSNSKTSSDPFN